MRVGVGYSENPDTEKAGRQAAESALRQAAADGACDFVLVFSTSRHDPLVLRRAIASVVGPDVPVVGGGAAGALSNHEYGYAGDQIALAAFFLSRGTCSLLTEPGLLDGEAEVGKRLGKRLGQLSVTPHSPVLLFYDPINRTRGDLRLIMATHILDGLEKSLGFLPNLIGAGLQGDYLFTPTCQWLGADIGSHHALALAFGGGVHLHSTIMHGCRPAAGPYTVTRAEGQTILEINGRPALDFLDALLGPAITPEAYPFFLVFGINKGERWSSFAEETYANRLCFNIDPDRKGIVMFEPDMVAGTEFEIMFRSLDLDYMAPRIEALFKELGDRKPVFALYINCAGRAAGYAGSDLEDAVVVQRSVGERVPLLGIYSGVEIAPVDGRPRGLDWTGVFSLFSVPK